MKVKFLVTPVGLMMGNIESARRLKHALAGQGVEVSDDPADERFDILHVHTPVPPGNLRYVKKAKAKGVPVVMHAHTTAEDAEGTWTGSTAMSGVVGRYLTRFYNYADLLLTPSSWTMDTLRARGVTAPMRVLSNGVDLSRFSFSPERRRRFRMKHGIEEDAQVVYSIGVVCTKKGVEVIPAVAKALPEVDFVWVGRRSLLYRPVRVGRAIRRSPENTRYLHDVADIVDAHCGGDVFFTPSFAENQGMAVMEAMAVGRPVVARNLPSYKGLLMDGETALLRSDVDGFVSAIDRVLKERPLSESLVANAKAVVSAHEISNVARDLKEIYGFLLNDKRTRIGGTA